MKQSTEGMTPAETARTLADWMDAGITEVEYCSPNEWRLSLEWCALPSLRACYRIKSESPRDRLLRTGCVLTGADLSKLRYDNGVMIAPSQQAVDEILAACAEKVKEMGE